LITFDLDKLNEKFHNKFHLVLAIVQRVAALKRGLQPIVDKRGKTLITTAIEELETDELAWEVHDDYVPPFRLEDYETDEAGLADEEAEVEEVDAVFAGMPSLEGEFAGAGGAKPEKTEEKAKAEASG